MNKNIYMPNIWKYTKQHKCCQLMYIFTWHTYVPPPTEWFTTACTCHYCQEIAALRKYGSQFASVPPEHMPSDDLLFQLRTEKLWERTVRTVSGVEEGHHVVQSLHSEKRQKMKKICNRWEIQWLLVSKFDISRSALFAYIQIMFVLNTVSRWSHVILYDLMKI